MKPITGLTVRSLFVVVAQASIAYAQTAPTTLPTSQPPQSQPSPALTGQQPSAPPTADVHAQPGAAGAGAAGAGAAGAGAAPAPKKDDTSTPDLAADFKAGKLIRYGITAGAAVAVHAPLHAEQTEWGVSAMPYIAVLPFWYGIRGSVTRAYCAEGWLMDDDAQGAANAAAVQLAQKNARRAGLPEADVEAINADSRETVLKYSGWNVDKTGKCGWMQYMPGIYAGIPAKFTANTKFSGDTGKVAREFDPIVSVGIMWAPVSAISMLFGVTLSNVQTDKAKSSQIVDSFTFGLGGNLDLVGALLGGGGGGGKSKGGDS